MARVQRGKAEGSCTIELIGIFVIHCGNIVFCCYSNIYTYVIYHLLCCTFGVMWYNVISIIQVLPPLCVRACVRARARACVCVRA